MVAYGSKHIEDFPVIRSGIANTVGSQQRQAKAMRYTDGCLVTPFFLTLTVALKFDIYILLSKEPDQLLGNRNCF